MKTIMRKQRIVMFPCSEHERYVKRQVEYLPSTQVREEYERISGLIELVDRNTLGFARTKISGLTWVLCRQYDGNPWQAVCCISKSGVFACGEPVKEEKPEIKPKKPRIPKGLQKEQARRSALSIPRLQQAQAMAAMAAMSIPPPNPDAKRR